MQSVSDEERGDTVSVVAMPFVDTVPVVDSGAAYSWMSILEWDTILKQVAAGIIPLLLVFFVLRPAFANLSAIPVTITTEEDEASEQSIDSDAEEDPDEIGSQADPPEQEEIEEGAVYEDNETEQALFEYQREDRSDSFKAMQKLIIDEPERAAQVLKNWVAE